MKTRIGMLSLGCARNLVDAEIILGRLKKARFWIADELVNADVAIVNTCCFIQEAQEESIDAVLQVCQLKRQGKVRKIIVCGCLPQRYQKRLLGELKEVDAFVGVGAGDKIVDIVKRVLTESEQISEFSQAKNLYSHTTPRTLLTPRHYAYVKISEGCNNCCSYCVIPSLRGRLRSRPMGSILKETQMLFGKGKAKEINLIGQDTTMYGQDLYGKSSLVILLKRLCAKAKDKWIRILYAHPNHFSQELIEVIKNEPAICKYVDLPIQHINDKILKGMRRRINRKQIMALIGKLRKEIPHLAIRTTLMAGFPGETDKQFGELLNFIADTRFERLGLFKYSQEEGTPAYGFSGQLSEKIKEARYNQALSLQQKISTQINQGFLGKEMRVLIDEQDRQARSVFLGRTQFDAPEVDGLVYVKSKRRLQAGEFVQAKIVDTLEYDLVGDLDESA